MKLSEARIGQDFEILAVRIPREVGRRLADMGFTEGARGRVIRRGVFRGPLQVRIRDYDVLLRRCEASGIEILPLETDLDGIPAESEPIRTHPWHPRWGVSRRGDRKSLGGRRPGRRGNGACFEPGVGSPQEAGE